MKKIILLILLLITTGCTSYTELNDLSIVNTMGIDYKDNNYYLNISVIDIDNLNNRIIRTYSSSDKDLNKAIQDIYLYSNKKLYLSHLDLLILTDNSINYKLDEILNNFLKNNEYRNNFQVVLMDDNSLNNYFNNNINSKDITNLIDTNNEETSIVTKKELEGFLNDIIIDNNSYLPKVSIDNNIRLDGYTLIDNNKVSDSLSINDSILLNILTNNVKKAYISDTNIYELGTKVSLKDNTIIFNINMLVDNKDNIDIIKNSIMDFLKYYQDKDYDILKLKELIKKNNYKYYKNNDNLLDKIKVKININYKIKNNYIKGGLNEK